MELTAVLTTLVIYFLIGFFLDVYLIRKNMLNTATNKRVLLFVFVAWIILFPIFVFYCACEVIVKLLSMFEDK